MATSIKVEDWQRSIETLAERDLYILENEKFTDCSFLVGIGSRRAEIHCHRVYLAKSSPVFEAMLYGNLSKNQLFNIPVTDTTPTAFKAFSRYIYSGKYEYGDYSLTCQLYQLAEKYLMPHSFTDVLRFYLWNEMPNNIWTALECLSHDEKLHGNAHTLLNCVSSGDLLKESFLQLSQTNLLTVLESEYLNCAEFALIDACIRWVHHQVRLENKIPSTSEVPAEVVQRKMLPLLPHLRFLTLVPDQFVILTNAFNFLPLDLSFKLLAHLTSPDRVTAPEEISQNMEQRCAFDREYLELHVCSFHERLIRWPGILTYLKSTNCSQLMSYFLQSKVRVPCNCREASNLHRHKISAIVPTQINRDKDPFDLYQEKFTIVVCGDNPDVALYHLVTQEVQYNSQITVDIDTRCNLALGPCHMFVLFHVAGVYPEKTFTPCLRFPHLSNWTQYRQNQGRAS